jgi:pimeloyl-ACP methyl ester carboxylesterase
MGRNLGRIENIETLANKIELLSKKHNQKVTLIGWSMGGIFAREVAKLKTDYVDRVLTIGSPFANVYAPNHARWIFDLLNDSKDLKPEIVNQLSEPPPQPTAALYSLSDGIVPWQACMDTPSTELHQNYEIESSHFGMGANPSVLGKIKELLAA